MKRVLVCGGRDITDEARVHRYLDRLHREVGVGALIEGDYRGADRIAGSWAQNMGIDNLKFRADWKRHGRRAGPMRNAKMLEEGRPDLVIAFPGGRGTADMIAKAEKAGVEVRRV